MKHLLCGLLLCLVCASIKAQNDSGFVEIGINAFRLIGVDRAAPGLPSDPYIFNLEVSNGKVGGRLGVGMYRSSETEKPSTFNGNSEFADDTSSTDVRVGLVLHKNLTTKWSVKYGVDGFMASRRRSYNSIVQDVDGIQVENVNEESRSETGAGIFVFPQFHISPRVSLATEMSFLFASTSYTKSVTNSEFTDFNSEVQKDGNYVRLRPPTALYIIVRF